MTVKPKAPPRKDLIRAVAPTALRVSDPDGDSGLPELEGHFAVFDEWTEINSIWEGRFLERIEPGAAKKTIRESRDSMRVLFQHGFDPSIGEKPLGPIRELREEDAGVYYKVDLLPTEYNAELIPGLRAGLYGASFRFEVVKEDFNHKPGVSEHNPEGIPERTIKEMRVFEFGPVVFPAYDGATAKVRSLSIRELRHAMPAVDDVDDENSDDVTPTAVDGTLSGNTDEPSHSEDRAAALNETTGETKGQTMTVEQMRARQDEIRTRLEEIDGEASGSLTAEAQEEWDRLVDERDELERNVVDKQERRAKLTSIAAGNGNGQVEETRDRNPHRGGGRASVPDNIWDVAEYRNRAFDRDELRRLYADGAKRAIEQLTFPHPDADAPAMREHLTKLLRKDDEDSELALRILNTTSDIYQRAFAKVITGAMLTPDEQRALSLTNTAGGYAVPIEIDPTVIMTSNGVVNPLRAISRVQQMTSAEWRGVSSAGVTASYAAEAAESTDNAPTLAQPTANAERAHVFIPYSFEVGQDWASLEEEMATMIQDAKDQLEATKFITGLGHASTEPEGLLVGGTAVVATAAATAFAVGDLYSLEEALPPRFRPRARFIANKKQYNRVRQFDTQGGAALWVRLDAGTPPELIGYPAHEASEMVSTLTSASSIVTFGDFSHFLIADRIGMSIEVLPHLLGSNRRPTGQRGLYAYWRNTSKVLAWQAFRTLKVT